MVKVEIVDEHNSPYASSAPSRTNSSDSLSSVASEASVPDESFYDRLSALVDIVPPTTRQSIAGSISKTTTFIKKTGKVVGNVVWIVTTSALLVGLPLALSLEDEAKIVQQEQEMLAQQQGAQQVFFFLPSGAPRPFSAIFSTRCSHPARHTHPQGHHSPHKKPSCHPASDLTLVVSPVPSGCHTSTSYPPSRSSRHTHLVHSRTLPLGGSLHPCPISALLL